MIIAKPNLQVYRVSKSDKNQNKLNLVHINSDGSSVAANSRSLLLVSPVREEIKDNIPLDEVGWEGGDITRESAKKLVKAIGKDRKFNGLLEYCNIEFGEDKTKASITDGKMSKVFSFHKIKKGFIKFRKMLKNIFSSKTKAKVVVNRARLLDMLKALKKVAPDRSKESPLFIEIKENGIVVKCNNQKTKQRIIGVMSKYQGEFVEKTDWEVKVTTGKTPRR